MIEFESDEAVIFHGNCLDVLRGMPDNLVDSIVTDPPYGLGNPNPNYILDALKLWVGGDREHIPAGKGFMGNQWDSFVPPPAVWDECFRVLKPGGHILVFAGSRTQDLMGMSIRMAGFEIRDSLGWVYASGFPKSLNVGRALGEEWGGWGTALKPAIEPIILARKPFSENTVVGNVTKHGVGAINIDGSRIGTSGENFDDLKGRPIQKLATRRDGETDEEYDARVLTSPSQQEALEKLKTMGRWPSNFILGHTENCVQTGTVQDSYKVNKTEEWSGFGQKIRPDYVSEENTASVDVYECVDGCPVKDLEEQITGGSRFFFVAKANKKDRNAGLDGLPEKGKVFNGKNPVSAGNAEGSVEAKFTTKPSANHHPTVKPTSLMQYLVNLVTPKGGIVLDPFAGSGSTGKAAILDGFRFIGVEMTDEYIPIIKGRIQNAIEEKSKK